MKHSFFAVLFVSILLFSLVNDVQAKKRQSKYEKFQKKHRDDCNQTICGHIPKDLNENCSNQCYSPTCFHKVYVDSPLEDGEYDVKRQRLFNDCTRDEFSACTKDQTQCPSYMIPYL